MSAPESPWAEIYGLLFGGAAFVVGALLTMHYVNIQNVPPLPMTPSETRVRLWYFYSTQNIEIEAQVSHPSGKTKHLIDPINIYVATRADQPWFLEYIPPAVLGVAGFLRGLRSKSITYGAYLGALLTIGYGICLLGFWGLSLKTVERPGPVGGDILTSVGPQLFDMIKFGLIYPLVYGTLGGVLGSALRPPE